MPAAISKPLTAREFMDIPEGPPYHQLIEGDLFMTPSPDAYHQDIVGNAFFLIRRYLEKHRIGVVRVAPSDVQLTELNVYEPDVYFVAKARRSILTAHGVKGAPNLVIEVLSPRTARLDKGAKRAVYARTGVDALWIIDGNSRRVHVYRFGQSADEPIGVYGVRQKFESPVFPGLKIPVADLFAR